MAIRMTNPTDREEGALSELGDKERRFVEDQRRIEAAAKAQGMTLPLSQSERLKEANALLAEAAEVLRAFVQEEPVGHGGVTDELYCVYCDGKQLGSPTWQFEHTKDCAWIRAKPLLDKLGERE